MITKNIMKNAIVSLLVLDVAAAVTLLHLTQKKDSLVDGLKIITKYTMKNALPRKTLLKQEQSTHNILA